MQITHIVAASENDVIGGNNQLLWKLPRDMRFFKNKTWGLPVVMGRKTFESLGSKPLKGRLNVVVSSEVVPSEKEGLLVWVTSFEQAIQHCEQALYKELMVIGGGKLYAATLPQTTKVFLTLVHTSITGDTYYPTLPSEEWTLAFEESFEADDTHLFPLSFQTWVRK